MSLLKTFLPVFLALMLLSFLPFSNEGDAIVGVWKNGEGTGMFKISKNGEKYQGKIVWLKEPNDPETGKPKLDKNHPDEKVRSRPVLGLINTWGFVVRGYIGISLIGRTDTWTRQVAK